MKYQIDQSGKIEQTSLITVIALANDQNYVVTLSKKNKRSLQKMFRDLGKSRLFIFMTFAALIAIVIKQANLKAEIIVDNEYRGHEDFIKELILKFLGLLNQSSLPSIGFGLVGKSSRAHILAAKVAVGKKKGNKIVRLEEIIKLVLSIKNDRVSRY